LIISNEDLKKGDTYYILGASPGEDAEKATKIFSQNDKRLRDKKVKIKAIHDIKRKIEAKEYLHKFGKENWILKYYPTTGPFQIGITNNYTLLILLEKNPITILINNKKIRDSFNHYFQMIWQQAKK
jgi:hypothetical protein